MLELIKISKGSESSLPIGSSAGNLTVIIRRLVSGTADPLEGLFDGVKYEASTGGTVCINWTNDTITTIPSHGGVWAIAYVYNTGAVMQTASNTRRTVIGGAISEYSSECPEVTQKAASSKYIFLAATGTGHVQSLGVEGDRIDSALYGLTPINSLSFISRATREAYTYCPYVEVKYSDISPANGYDNITIEIADQSGPPPTDTPRPTDAPVDIDVRTCGGKVIIVSGVTMSTNDFVNAQTLINEVGSDDSDPIADEYEGYIANGKNVLGTTGLQDPLPKQTELPDPSPIKPVEKEETVKDVPVKVQAGCSSWADGNYDAQMSTNFILRNFTIGYPEKAKNLERGCLFPNRLINIPGYDVQTRFCNLQLLAQNVLEPIWAKFGAFRVNSGIRNQNSVKSGVSQHVTGEAVDIQFPGWNYEMYWENAKWVKDNVPFDQFIFEHSAKTGLAWFHLSFRRSGNRPASDRTKVMTMYRGRYDSGLRRYK